ncbi:MAG TPA: acetyl-coenzyme A synthetase N-terminal domain-containing protein, partial [Flavobacteriales bacterium]|nr:acetyl-coenzyme A synthetase N-terminal domain-containing protein [Flavobacteriales bacterium]
MDLTRIRTQADYDAAYRQSITDPEGFWAAQAATFSWKKKWDRVLEWDFTKAETRWFIGGRLNITENCLDRHLATRGDKTAIIWEPNDPDEEAERITYRELYTRVCRYANVLKRNGAKKGDRICVYLP